MAELSIDSVLRPGDLGAIVEQHGRLYRVEHGFDERFEAYVGTTVGEAMLSDRAPPPRFWIVREGGRFAGSAAVCPAGNGVGQFRWFLLEPSLRGRGIGRRLLTEALEHSQAVGYHRLFLLTVDALEAAAALYRSAGFIETERFPQASPWGVAVTEVRYELRLR